MDHAFYMSIAFKQALKAQKAGEVPVGAVIVKDRQIISQAYNTREKSQSATHHAEILAIQRACRQLKSWRLNGSSLYVTLEPCLMCAGALLMARVEKLVYGCKDPKIGAVHSQWKALDYPQSNHRLQVVSGIMEEDCSRLIKNFFANLREKN